MIKPGISALDRIVRWLLLLCSGVAIFFNWHLGAPTALAIGSVVLFTAGVAVLPLIQRFEKPLIELPLATPVRIETGYGISRKHYAMTLPLRNRNPI